MLQSLPRTLALLVTERRIGLELIFIQDKRLPTWVNPYIEQEINLLNKFVGD
jgi:hypothetical protein